MREGSGFHLTAIFLSFLFMIVMTYCSMWFSITLVEGDRLQHPTTPYRTSGLENGWMKVVAEITTGGCSAVDKAKLTMTSVSHDLNYYK